MRDTLVGAVLGFALGTIVCSLSAMAESSWIAVDEPMSTHNALTCDGRFCTFVGETTCEQKMEAAMRAMEPYLSPPQEISHYDGCNHCDSVVCTTLACTPGPEMELRRLEWEVEQAKKQVERENQRQAAMKQLAAVKRECWREP